MDLLTNVFLRYVPEVMVGNYWMIVLYLYKRKTLLMGIFLVISSNLQVFLIYIFLELHEYLQEIYQLLKSFLIELLLPKQIF